MTDTERTYWNGERCEARRVRVVVAEWDEAVHPPRAWWRQFVGQERDAVEVTYAGQTFYLDDEGFEVPEDIREFQRTRAQALRDSGEDWAQPLAESLEAQAETGHSGSPGWGWAKVTGGRGSPQYGHADFPVARVLEVESGVRG